MLKNWIKVFIYQLKQNKLFSILNALGLSIGIAGVIFAILYWNEEHSYNQWNPEKDNDFQVINDLGDGMKWPYNVAPVGKLVKEASSNIESYCYADIGYRKDLIGRDGKKEMVEKIMNAQSNFFTFFPFEFIEGTAASAIPDNSSIALEEKTAQRFFGSAKAAMGKQLWYVDKMFTVRGVYRIPGKSSAAPNVVVSIIDENLKTDLDQWGNFSYSLWLKLKDPTKADAVARTFEKVFIDNRSARYAKEEGMSLKDFLKKNGYNKILLEKLDTVRLHSIVDGFPEGNGNYKFLLIMSGLSVLILILSIVNYINLATASAIKRAKEVGVRKIIGAGKSNIILQFLTETAFTTVFSILLALAIVELSLPFYNDLLNKNLILTGSEFYLQLIIIFFTVIIFAGIFPAVYVSNFETLKVLKGNFGRSKSGIWLRNGMLVLQFSIATFFVIGSYIVYEQVDYMATKDLGFKGNQVLDITYRNNFDWKKPDYRKVLKSKYELLKQELLKMPGVKKVSGGAFHFGDGATSSSGFHYKDIPVQAQNMAVDYDFFDILKVKLISGRKLSPEFASDSVSNIIINKTAQRLMKEPNPVGKEIQWNNYKFRIVGVVDDFHIKGLNEEIPPMVFLYYSTVDWMLGNMKSVFVTADPATMSQTTAAIEKFWVNQVDPHYPFTYDFVDKTFARTYENYVKQKMLFSILNVVVILIALFGLFALASFSIERRMKEIAIRKTLGAETGSLLKELSRQYLLFCIIGFLIAFFPTRLILAKWLEEFAYRIEITTLPFFIGFAALCMLTVAVVVAKAFKATRIDVLHYLKYE